VVVEVAVLIGVTHLLGGFGWALLLLLATSAVGGLLLRREGIRAWRRFRVAAQEGRSPGEEVTNGLVGLLGAVLLVLPGFVTDLVGLALLAPPVRRLARSRVQSFAERRLAPALATDLFGPRRVRVREPRRPAEPTEPGEAIEGEIIEPHGKPPGA
jgi:UPF0716 protein FxsA